MRKFIWTVLCLTGLASFQNLEASPTGLMSPTVRPVKGNTAEVAKAPLAAQTSSDNSKTLPTETVRRLEFSARFAWFLPQSGRIQRVYGHHGCPEYELEASMSLDSVPNCSCHAHDKRCEPHWIGWGNWSIYEQSGHSTCLKNSSHMINNAANFGVKYYFFHMHGFRPYLGFGLGFAHVRFSDHSKYVRHHVDKWGPSLLVKSGIECDFLCHWYADVFVDYGSNWFSAPRSKHCVKTNDINTGGGKFGFGLGYRF